MPEPVPAPSMAEQRAAFRQRATERLQSERSETPEPQPAAPEAAAPSAPLDDGYPGEVESTVDETLDYSQEGFADEEDEEGALEGSAEDPNDGAPLAEDQEADGNNVDWEKRYKDLQSETQNVMEARGEMEQEHAQAMSDHLKLRFQMEDRLNEYEQRAQYMANTMSGNAEQYRQLNWSQVPPDQVAQVQQEAQQAFLFEQQQQANYQQVQEFVNGQKAELKRREAEIAKARLRRTIPNWGQDTYQDLRQFAAESGMSVEAFNEITDPVVIEWAYAARQMREGASQVRINTNRKAQAPRGKQARRQPRNDRGQFQRKQTEPNVRGSFADRHKHRLAAERKGQ